MAIHSEYFNDFYRWNISVVIKSDKQLESSDEFTAEENTNDVDDSRGD